MQRRLINNADGYGFTPGVNEGIVATFRAGLVTSTSCTPNFGHLGDAGKVAKEFPHVSFGIHFNLSVGKPLCDPKDVPSLVDGNGTMWGERLLEKIRSKHVRHEDCVKELSAQAAILADQDVKISHFDGHQNKHLYPVYFDACLEVGKKFNIRGIRCHNRALWTNSGPVAGGALIAYYLKNPVRFATHTIGRKRTAAARAAGFMAADRLITPGYADTSHKSHRRFWETLAATLPPGSSEVYCHPAIPDDLLRANAKYTEPRLEEMKILTDPALVDLYKESQIQLINFFEL